MKFRSINMLAGFVAGLLCACGGAWKDAPYEGFKFLTFTRSIWVGTLMGFITAQITEEFWVAMACAGYFERCAVEGYKILRRMKPGKFEVGEYGHPRPVKEELYG